MTRTRFKPAKAIPAIILVLIPLIMWRFYWYVGFNSDRTALFSFLLSAGLVLFMLILLINGTLRRINSRSEYSRYLIALLFLFFVSMINAALYWNQSFSLTFRAGYMVLVVVYFYVLFSLNISQKDIMKLVLFFSAVYLLIWTYAVSQAPHVVFGNLEEVRDDRGFARIINLKSIDLVYLLYFVSLVKASSKGRTYKILWIVLTVISFVLILYSLSRMVILAALIVTMLFLFRNKPLYLILSIAAIIAFSSYIFNNPVVATLFDLTSFEISSGSESALRIVEYTQFMDLYPFHIGTTLFGNGAPHIASSYGVFEESLKSGFRFHRTDAGFVGLYVTYGLASIVLFASLLLRVLKQKVTNDAMPYKLFIVFLFIINITSFEFFNCGVGFMIALYMLDKDKHVQHNQMQIVSPTA